MPKCGTAFPRLLVLATLLAGRHRLVLLVGNGNPPVTEFVEEPGSVNPARAFA
jgi:hypothetical protein